MPTFSNVGFFLGEIEMFNCSKEVLKFHNDKVSLPQDERDEMRDRRNSNRTRLRDGLKTHEKPKVREFHSQGSYSMKTMTQHPAKDYDIDDGVYFDKSDLKNADETNMSPAQAKEMVRNAVDDGSFKTKPKVKTNCVRVQYEAGYHVDLPVYRKVTAKDVLGNEEVFYELASSEWKRSDAREVTGWFDGKNKEQSPDATNGRQLRRMTRETKKFARSRANWIDNIACGFMITKLVTECYVANEDREDIALYETMKAIRDRLELDLEVKHPVTPDDYITSGPDDSSAKFLKDKLSDAISWLAVLFETDCTAKKALAAWDKVFNTNYFTNCLEDEEGTKSAPSIVVASGSGSYSRVVQPRPSHGEK